MAGMLEGRTALVTGAGGGIGRQTALIFVREGARVVVADLGGEALENTAAAVRGEGGEVLAVACDVTDPRQVEGLFQQAVSHFGRLDCAHNNAGIEGEYGRTAQTTVENLDRCYQVNLRGVFLCMQAELRIMMEGGGGAIVNTASVAGIEGARNLPAYAASKHAVMGLTRSAALEYATKGIRVNAVCPGPIQTRMLEQIMSSNPRMEAATVAAIPMRRLGEPHEIGEAVAWLCSDRASFVNGHGLVVDGGMTAGS